MKKIQHITNEQIQQIKKKTPTGMFTTNKPNQEGFTPAQIRDAYTHALLDPNYSIVKLINDLIDNLNNEKILTILPTLPSSLEGYENQAILVLDKKKIYNIDENANVQVVFESDIVYYDGEIFDTNIINRLNEQNAKDKIIKVYSEGTGETNLVDFEDGKIPYGDMIAYYHSEYEGIVIWYAYGIAVYYPEENKLVNMTISKEYLDKKIQNIAEKAEGKTATHIISISNNPAFNNNYEVIETSSEIITIKGKELNAKDLKVGDNILIIDRDVPDRWIADIDVQNNIMICYMLETRKIDLSEINALLEELKNTKADKTYVDNEIENLRSQKVDYFILNEAIQVAKDEINQKFDTKTNNLESRISDLENVLFDFEEVSSNTYQVSVPDRVLSNASIDKIGGMSYKSKNLFNISKIQPFASNNTISISNVTENSITITTTEEHTGNGSIKTQFVLKELAPNLAVGKTYTLSGITQSSNKKLYLSQSNTNWVFGTSQTITQEMLDSDVIVLGLLPSMDGYGDCVISNIQIEEGTTATEYETYFEGIRDSAVTEVRSVGENILGLEDIEETQYGLTYLVKNGVITINGTTTGIVNILLPTKNLEMLTGQVRFGAFTNQATSSETYNVLRITYEDMTTSSAINLSTLNPFLNISLIKKVKAFGFRFDSGVTLINFVIKPYIVMGTGAISEFKPYFESTFVIPSSIQELEGWGEGTTAAYYNYIDFETKEWVQMVYEEQVETVYLSADTKYCYMILKNNFKNDSNIPLANIVLTNFNGNSIIQWNEFTASTTNAIYWEKTSQDRIFFRIPTATTSSDYTNYFKENITKVIYVLSTPIRTDISHLLTEDLIRVESNGSLTLVNTYNQDVPSTFTFQKFIGGN